MSDSFEMDLSKNSFFSDNRSSIAENTLTSREEWRR